MSEIVTIDAANATLAKLTASLDATTLGELHATHKSADAFRHILRLAKFDLLWQNRFAAIRFKSMRRIGAMLADMPKHQGGRPAQPLPGDEGLATLDDMGISYNFSSECQRIAAMLPEDFESYLARGGSEDIELTKAGLFQHEAGAITRRQTEAAPVPPDTKVIPFSPRSGPRGPRNQRGKNNKVRTNPEFALEIVRHFAPQFGEDDTFIDPCLGDGAFFDAMCKITVSDGGIEWCEIDPACICEGFEPRDFLTHTDHMDWAITNTPWSADEYAPIFRHALEVCDNIVFLIRAQNATTTARRNEWEAAGFGLKEIAICRWQDAGFPPEGLPLAAMHWQRGWTGPTTNSKIVPADMESQPEIILPIKPAGNSESDNLETNSEAADDAGPYKWWLYDGEHEATGYTLTYDDALHFLWDLYVSGIDDASRPYYEAEYTKDLLDRHWDEWLILSLPETDDDGDDWEEAKRSLGDRLPDECPYLSRYDRAMKLLLQLSEMGLQDTEMSTDERTNLRAMLFDVGGCIAADDKELLTGII